MGPQESVAALAEQARPVALAGEQVMPVLPALAPLLPGGGLRRGTTVAVADDRDAGPDGAAATSLALALLAQASAAGSWTAAVGFPSLGLLAAAEAGLALERLALVAAPQSSVWPTVVATLVDAFDLVLLRPGTRVGAGAARRLVARARERGAVLVLVATAGARPGTWPEAPDLRLRVTAAEWQGLGHGHGHLRARRVTAEAGGRGRAARPRRVDLWLPGADGQVTPLVPLAQAAAQPLREVG